MGCGASAGPSVNTVVVQEATSAGEVSEAADSASTEEASELQTTASSRTWPPQSWSNDLARGLAVQPLPDTTLNGVPVGEHLLLSITEAGVVDFLRRIDFPFQYNDCGSSTYSHKGFYVRNEGRLGWVTKLYGPVEYRADGSVVASSLTGYDLADTIRSWLEFVGQEGASVCEVLLAEGTQARLRLRERRAGLPAIPALPAVRRNPHSFNSHVQFLPIGSTLYEGFCRGAMRMNWKSGNKYLPRGIEPSDCENVRSQIYWWLDYFVLRQCKHDFSPFAIHEVIKYIGHTNVELDTKNKKVTYFARTFCLFEMASTIDAGSCLFINCDLDFMNYIEKNPVESADAQTRDPHDKEQIDDYIRDNVEGGFAGLNAKITAAIKVGCKLSNSTAGW